MLIDKYLTFAIKNNASDLHLIPQYYPAIRINQKLNQIKVFDILNEKEVEDITFSFINSSQKEILLTNKQLDFGYQYENYRLRINAYYAKGNLCLAIRILNSEIKTIEQLNLPPSFYEFTKYTQGLILITGPTGEGKSTTLAALINHINKTQEKHIVTLEDPIEYLYPKGCSIVSQRELYQDTYSWKQALKAVLREDPDVVLVGEMRDYESISLVLTIAETGHLVFSTLHTSTAAETISRIIDVFPSDQQGQIKSQLSSVLIAVIAQRLIPTINKNLFPALEILYNTSAVSEIIRSGRFEQLTNVLLTNERDGMIIFEKYLIDLINKGYITNETAFKHSFRPKELKKLIGE